VACCLPIHLLLVQTEIRVDRPNHTFHIHAVFEIYGSRSDVEEYLGLLGCDALPAGKYLSMFQLSVCFRLYGIEPPKKGLIESLD